MAEPVLKWAGGKRELYDEVVGRLPPTDDLGTYIEPFLGGGAIMFGLEYSSAVGTDLNERLINCYRMIRDRPDSVIGRLQAFDDPESAPDPDLGLGPDLGSDSDVGSDSDSDVGSDSDSDPMFAQTDCAVSTAGDADSDVDSDGQRGDRAVRESSGGPAQSSGPAKMTDWKGRDIDSYYYQQRARFNRRAYGDDVWPDSPDERIEEAALMVYLNRTCYNGLYRTNQDGGFNVPIGRYADPDWVQADRIRELSSVLEPTTLGTADFKDVLGTAGPDDTVYCDPPYEPMSPTADFTEYTADGFDRDDQERLLDELERLDRLGTDIVVTNSAVVADEYEGLGFDVDYVGVTRSINSDADERGKVEELVATNIEPDRRRGDHWS